ncbi:MAG: amidohydrolase family protein [Gammaproteobacteria bacterium]|nr:amidohydrolase family protein [Gammaproteobacteria bacterium]
MTETLFTGGTIITMDDLHPLAEAVVVRNGKIEYVGDEPTAKTLVSTDHEQVDLAGHYLLPGFIEAHSHPLWAAKTRGDPVVDVRAETVPTYVALIAKIKRRVAVAKPDEYLLFFGLDAQLHPDMEPPSRAFLDQLAPNNPIGIQTSNCHALYLNSAGLDACGIDETFVTPEGSIVERDIENRPTGMVGEAITWRALETFYEAWGDDRLSEQFEASIREFVENGITTVTEHLYMPFYKAYYINALKKGLPLPRIAAYQQATTHDMQVEEMDLGEDRLWMAGVKIHADGSPFIGNIWLTEPYLESEITIKRMDLKPGHTGSLNYPQAFFDKMLKTYFDAGWQMSIHTQGDRTIDMVLDLVETLIKESPQEDHRFRLEHCALMRIDQIKRAKKLGVLCSFFINHITHWGAPIEDSLFGKSRAAHYMPVGSAVKEGVRTSLHADTPMTDPSALELMKAATTRIAGDGRCLGPEERISLESALKSVTIDAAYQINMEGKLGSITSGKHADFVLLDGNPLEAEPGKLTEISIKATYLAGTKVWMNEE